MRRPPEIRESLAAALALVLAGCSVGPNYEKPPAASPATFKEAPVDASQWKVAEPADRTRPAEWWTLFGDPDLDALEKEVATANTTIAQAEARYRAAREVVRQSRSAYYPMLTASAGVTRARGALRNGTSVDVVPVTQTTYGVSADASWELDIWGRVRRDVESSLASAEAAADDLEAARLSMQAELAVDWFTLHGFDEEIELLNRNAEAEARALTLTKNRHDQGVVSGVDVAQAETLWETTRTQVIEARLSRAQTEHAIAFLVGKAPADLTIPPAKISVPPPAVPGVLPSELLERRPDVAAAERRAAAASAQIGVAVAAYFPSISISASAGFVSSTLANLFTAPSFVWSVGPAALATLFDAGRRRAVADQRRAEYDAAVGAYRETALHAFQEVEDQLVAVRLLEEEERQQALALAAANRALELAVDRYRGGITTYLEVVIAQSIAFANERTAVDLATRRRVATVNLVKAVGGDFEPTAR